LRVSSFWSTYCTIFGVTTQHLINVLSMSVEVVLQVSLGRLLLRPGNTNWGGRLSTVDILIKVDCFVKSKLYFQNELVHGGKLYWAFPFSKTSLLRRSSLNLFSSDTMRLVSLEFFGRRKGLVEIGLEWSAGVPGSPPCSKTLLCIVKGFFKTLVGLAKDCQI
jgi:hypothetical protein